MCKNAYEQISDRTKKLMIFCKLLGETASLSHLCVSQKFCPQKNKYIATDQKRNCKFYK